MSSLKTISKKLKALAHPTRLKLLSLLREKSLCVCELTHALELAQPTVSRHLQQLEEAGFVDKRKNGYWIIYTLAPRDDTSAVLLETVLPHTVADVECAALIKKLAEIDRCALSGCGRQREKSAV